MVLMASALPAIAATSNPLGKVLELMDGLTAKITKEGEEEAAAYKKYFAWCDEAARETKFSIKTAEKKKEKLEAAIGKATGDIEASVAKIEELAKSISTSQ